MKVLIADGSADIVAVLYQLLERHPLVTEIYKANSYSTAKAIFIEQRPNVVLLDNNFPENNSLKLLAEIKTHHFACKVIMLSNQHNAYINNQCNVRGANFIIDKNNEVDKLDSLLTAIKTGGSIN